MGMSGRRGGLNTVTAVLEQARLAAIENGTTAYVGFPTNSINPTNGYSHLIIFRDARRDDANTNRVPVTRWQRLPNGVFFAPGTNFGEVVVPVELAPRTLPRLGTEDLPRIPALAFNRFGQIQGVNSQALVLLLGEKVEPAGASWRGGPGSFYELRVQPLTGRTLVRDMSTNRGL